MKVLLRYLALVITLVLATAGVVTAQEPVSTGIIQGIQPKEGTLTLRSDQTQNLTTFFGVDKANIQTTDGQVMTIDSLQLGTRVTVQYTQRGKQWFISKVILPPAAPLSKAFP
jgi:formylmethanofuran dehydrogenase subunit E-like metal-binding protein